MAELIVTLSPANREGSRITWVANIARIGQTLPDPRIVHLAGEDWDACVARPGGEAEACVALRGAIAERVTAAPREVVVELAADDLSAR